MKEELKLYTTISQIHCPTNAMNVYAYKITTCRTVSTPNIIRVIKSRRIRWVGYIERMGERRRVYRVLVGKPVGRRSIARPRHRWEDNNKMDLQEVGWGMGLIYLVHEGDNWRAVVNAVMNLRVPQNEGIYRLAENRLASQEGLCSME